LTLVCTHCSGDLIRHDTHYACADCGRVYPVRAGVFIIDDTNAVDLRVPARLHFADFTTFHAEMLAPYLDRSIVVDLGRGHISYINAFSDSGVGQYYGVDLTPVKSGCADAVISSETLEHLDDPIAHMRELGRICKKGGYLSLSTPCASMYLYPYNLVTFLMNPVRFYKKLNCHRYWHEALSWHPGLRPAVLRQWVRDAGFTVIAHKTREWYYNTPIRLVYRALYALEQFGFSCAGGMFDRYLGLTDRLLKTDLPVVKWCGIRQFILCRKI